jgi:hypothetical protein
MICEEGSINDGAIIQMFSIYKIFEKKKKKMIYQLYFVSSQKEIENVGYLQMLFLVIQ